MLFRSRTASAESASVEYQLTPCQSSPPRGESVHPVKHPAYCTRHISHMFEGRTRRIISKSSVTAPSGTLHPPPMRPSMAYWGDFWWHCARGLEPQDIGRRAGKGTRLDGSPRQCGSPRYRLPSPVHLYERPSDLGETPLQSMPEGLSGKHFLEKSKPPVVLR